MGNTSSQPAAPMTEANVEEEEARMSESEVESQDGHESPARSVVQDANVDVDVGGQLDGTGGSPSSEVKLSFPSRCFRDTILTLHKIAVASPRSKVVMERSSQAPQEQERERELTHKKRRRVTFSDDGAEVKIKKRKRKSSDGQARAPRGRPRDPSQLKPEVTTEPISAVEEIVDSRGKVNAHEETPTLDQPGAAVPEQPPADLTTPPALASPETATAQAPVDPTPRPAKKHKLSKADRHMLELAGNFTARSDDRLAGEQLEQEDASAASRSAKKTKKRRKRNAMTEAETEAAVETAAEAQSKPTGEDAEAAQLRDAQIEEPTKADLDIEEQPFAAPSTGRKGDRRVSDVGECASRRRRESAALPAEPVTQEDVALDMASAEPVRRKRKKRSPQTPHSQPEIPGMQTQEKPDGEPHRELDAVSVDKPLAEEAADGKAKKGDEQQLHDSMLPKDEEAAEGQESPASKPHQQRGVHSDGRRISAIGRPGPPKRKKQKVARPQAPQEAAQRDEQAVETLSHRKASQNAVAQEDYLQAWELLTSAEQEYLTKWQPKLPEILKKRKENKWPAEKRTHIATAMAKHLMGLPQNAGKFGDVEEATELCIPNEGFAHVVLSLRTLGVHFDLSALGKVVGRSFNETERAAEATAPAPARATDENPNRNRRSAQRIPTPPESPNERETYGVDATDQVKEWLSSQGLPISDPNQPSARKRKASHGNDEDAQSEYMPDPEPERDANATYSQGAQRKSDPTREPNIERSTKVNLPAPLEDGPESGSFTDAEKATADAVFDYICQNNGLSAAQLKRQIADWKTAVDFKDEILTALPRRDKTAVRKFCQRRYTQDEKGPWTAEQDEALSQSYTKHPNEWAEIAKNVGRSGQDCRDRWRNHLRYGGQKETGPWSHEEEQKLVAAVKECVEMVEGQALMQHDTELATDRARMEKMVNWDTVADKMEGKRGMKRCREKWQILKRRAVAEKTVEQPAVEQPAAEAQPNPEPQPAHDGHSKKQRVAERKLKQFQYGDYYDVLTEIHTSIDDHSKIFKEESTFWSIVATKNQDSRFNGALRRRAYHEALKNYANDKKVNKAVTIAAKAKAMAKSMIKWSEKNGIGEFERGYDPVGAKEKRKAERKAKEEKRAAKRAAEGEEEGEQTQRKKAARKVKKSEDYVVESDEEGQAEQAQPNTLDDGNEEPDGGDDNVEEAPAAVDNGSGDEHEAAEGNEGSEYAEEESAETDGVDGQVEDGGIHRMLEVVDDFPISSVNSRYEASLDGGAGARISPGEFVARCRDVGMQQHADYLRQQSTRRV